MKIICPACCGDGKETCNNPDHGLLNALSFKSANESRCPCCGHDPNYKIRFWKDDKWQQRNCEYCEGTGTMSEKDFNIYCDIYGYDEEPNYIEDGN